MLHMSSSDLNNTYGGLQGQSAGLLAVPIDLVRQAEGTHHS